MTIPEISPLLLISMCGLSFVCVGLFAVVGMLFFRLVAGDAMEGVTGMFGLGPDEEPIKERRVVAERRDLRSRAQSLDFDPSGGVTASAQTQTQQFGENVTLRPDRRPTFNEKTRDWDLAPPGRLSDDPRNMRTPAPPDFNPNSEYLPNDRSNIGGRVGRHNTGRGQTGQRMDASRFGSSNPRGVRGDRNVRRDDEFFGGQADFDGDGDPDI